MTDKKRKLSHLEAVERGRALGVVGATAATVGDWLRWLWDTPGTLEAMQTPLKSEAEPALTAPTNARAAFTTTYSRMTKPISEERAADTEELEWTQFHIVTEEQSETSYGAIEEAMFAIDGDEIVLADIDGRIFATHQLASVDDPQS